MFLWVRLVVIIIENRLNKAYNISEIKMTLDTLPRDLEKPYKEMLKKLEPYY